MGKPELWQDLSTATLETQASRLRQCRFVIVDLSGLSKKCAQQMEGLAGVYDGSEDETSRGFWLCNITAVNNDATLVVPASFDSKDGQQMTLPFAKRHPTIANN